MIIVTDGAADLSPEQLDGLNVHFAPLRIILDGQTYTSGVDLQRDEFYELLLAKEHFPTTSTPSPGDFAAIYAKLAEDDPEILSIHVSSGLSGTLDTAKVGASMVPDAKVTFFDSKTLSCPLGWQVEAAARAAKAGWTMERVLGLLERVRFESEGLFTLNTLKYLIHGGRISHLKGLLGSLLNIKPIIGPEKVYGKYQTLGQEPTFSRALQRIVSIIEKSQPRGSAIRVQLLHGSNFEGVELLRQKVSQVFDCHWLPTVRVAPVLGAHTGPSLVGLAVAPALVNDLMP